MTDNFVFSRHITPGYAAFYSGATITTTPLTISSALSQAVSLWHTWCGRFSGNLAVFLLFMLPHWLYCLIAALTFSLYTLLLLMCVFGRQWKSYFRPGWLLAIAALLWASIPSFGEAFLWLSVGGQIALLGQAIIFLPYRFALDNLPKNESWLKCLLLFCTGAFIASLDFATSAALPPTALACSIWLLLRQTPGQRRIPRGCIACALGLSLGGMFTLFAPGNAQRLLLTRDNAVIAWLDMGWTQRFLDWLCHLPLAFWMQAIPLTLLIWGICAIHNKNAAKLPVALWLYLAPCLLTHLAYIFTAWPAARAFASCSAQMIIAALIVCWKGRDYASKRALVWLRWLRSCLIIYCLVSISWESIQFQTLHEQIVLREQIITQAKGDDVIVPPLHVASDSYQTLGNELLDITSDPNFWVNRAVAAFYGLRSIRTSPESAINYLTPDDDQFLALPESRSIKISLKDRHIEVASNPGNQKNADWEAHFYYPGKPGILWQFPPFISHKIYDWLRNCQPGDWRLYLVPLLLARADVAVKNGNGQSILLKLETAEPKLWLVKPGSGKVSFSIMPLTGYKQSGRQEK